MASTSSGTGTTIVAVRSYQVIKIDGYSRSLNSRGHRPSFNSEPFRAGGHTWHVIYKPMGSPYRPENTRFISFFLVLDDDVVDEAVVAKGTFTLLDQSGRPVYAHTVTTIENNFSVSRVLGKEMFIRRRDLERSRHLKDDSFAIRVHVHIIKEARSMVVPPPDIHRHLGDLLLSGNECTTDVEFRVRGETFAAHRLLLGARSPVFRAMLFGPMKEGTSAAGAIQIDDMEAQVFGALLGFVYTDVWPETTTMLVDEQDEGVMAQHLLVAADRYGLPRLKRMCEERLQKHMGIGSLATVLALAEQHQCGSLKEACFSFLGFSSMPFFLDEEVIDGTEKCEYLSRNCPIPDLISGLLALDLERARLAEFCSRIPLFRGF